MRRKSQAATMFGADPETSVKKTMAPCVLWLPEPQVRWAQPKMPGKCERRDDDGRLLLWFERSG